MISRSAAVSLALVVAFRICEPTDLVSQGSVRGGVLRFSQQALQEDFLQMRRTLEENHANLYEYTPKDVMDRLMDEQFELIRDSMALHEFFVLLTPIIAKIGCGHTTVWMPMSYWEENSENLFPLQIRLIEEKVVVSGEYTESEQLPRGSVIREINGRPMAEIIREMRANYPADAMNPHFIDSQVERRFPMIYARRFGFPDKYRILYTTPNRDTLERLVLTPASNQAVRAVVFNNFSRPELSLRLLREENVAVLRIASFIFYDRVPYFTHFLDSSFAVIHEKSIKNLILDVRGNDGGDPFCAVPLFSYLEPRPLPYFAKPYGRYARFAEPIPRAKRAFHGNLLVLLDGRCFSTNAHFCALLKYHKIGTFVGTPSGATYKCNAGKNTKADLKNTRIMLYFGRSTFAAAVQGMDKAEPILPDVPVRETYEDVLGGGDVTMEAAMKLLRP